MRFDVLTLFPEAFKSFKTTSIIGRAVESGLLEINLFDIRDFATNKHRSVDDVPYGGGSGMVMSCQPLFDAINHVKDLADDQAPVIFLTPHGQTWDQEMAEAFAGIKNVSDNHEQDLGLAGSQVAVNSKLEGGPPEETGFPRVILLCGHYEGIDQRIRDHLVDREISLGDYVLTGGELAAQIFIDSVGRLIPGVIGKESSHLEESFSQKLGRDTLEYPHYTRPEEFNGWKVPAVLLSGHHAHIEAWRTEQCRQKPEA